MRFTADLTKPRSDAVLERGRGQTLKSAHAHFCLVHLTGRAAGLCGLAFTPFFNSHLELAIRLARVVLTSRMRRSQLLRFPLTLFRWQFGFSRHVRFSLNRSNSWTPPPYGLLHKLIPST